METFKRELDKFLFKLMDQPSLDSYVALMGMMTNSLMDQAVTRKSWFQCQAM